MLCFVLVYKHFLGLFHHVPPILIAHFKHVVTVVRVGAPTYRRQFRHIKLAKLLPTKRLRIYRWLNP